MKKILSLALTAAMLLSLIIVAGVPASAVDGMWVTYARPASYLEGEDGEPAKPRIMGYEYTEEGFRTIPADWTETLPFGTVQSRDPVNIEDGIYMEFRIDKYDYTANDMWIDVSFWDSRNISPGSSGYGEGVQTLIRPSQVTESNPQASFSSVDWYYREFSRGGKSSPEDGSELKVGEDGTVVFTVELTNNGGRYSLTINGCKAPDGVMSYFAKKFADGEAYVGISMRNTKVGSEVALTITRFGTSKETATVPQGDDRMEPVNPAVEEKAPIAAPDTVAPGMPAIMMTGDKTNSDCDGVSAGQGDTYQVNDDFSVRFIDTNDDVWTSAGWSVGNDVSYDIDDFPVMMFLTKNFCTCPDPEDCYATESCKAYLMTGLNLAGGANCMTPEIDICWEPIRIADEDGEETTYLYFWYDSGSEIAQDVFDAEGRIHSVRLDFSSLKREEGRNVVTIEWVAFFRSVEEGEAFVMNYLGLNGEEDTEEPTDEPDADPTEAKTDGPTDEPTVDPTEAKTDEPAVEPTEAKTDEPAVEPTEAKTDAPKGEDKTDAPKGEDKTEAPKGDDKPADDKPADQGSCGSVIGAGAVAVIAMVVTCGAVVLKKKED